MVLDNALLRETFTSRCVCVCLLNLFAIGEMESSSCTGEEAWPDVRSPKRVGRYVGKTRGGESSCVGRQLQLRRRTMLEMCTRLPTESGRYNVAVESVGLSSCGSQ